MKNLFIIISFFFVFHIEIQAQTQSIERFVNHYKSQATGEKVDISLPGWLVRLGSHFIDEDNLDVVDIRAIAQKISFIRIVTAEGVPKIPQSEWQDVLIDAQSANFEPLMTVRSEGDNIHILIREKTDFIRDLFILVQDSQGELVLLNIGGKFTMEDITLLMQDMQRKKVKNL
jgi:hypothetical protein